MKLIITKTVFIAISTILFSCQKESIPTGEEQLPQTWKVYNQQFECTGVDPTNCLRIQKGNGEWELFYNKIQDFDFEEGYNYTIKVNEDHLQTSLPSSNESTVKYTLDEVIKKEKAPSIKGSSWILKKINGEKYVYKDNSNDVTLNIGNDLKITGKAPCNSFFGSLETLTEKELKTGMIGSTQMACPELDNETTYLKALEAVKIYLLDNNTLFLINETGTTVLVYERVK